MKENPNHPLNKVLGLSPDPASPGKFRIFTKGQGWGKKYIHEDPEYQKHREEVNDRVQRWKAEAMENGTNTFDKLFYWQKYVIKVPTKSLFSKSSLFEQIKPLFPQYVFLIN